MDIEILPETKIRIARIGPVRTFGDYDARKAMTDTEISAVFDNAWEGGLHNAVARSLPCEYEVAHARLKGRQQEFLDSRDEQRQFRFQDMEFIAQLRLIGSATKELTQLWKVQSGDDYPKTIFVTFATVQERQRFKTIAETLHLLDEQLAVSLLRDFMAKFDDLIPHEET